MVNTEIACKFTSTSPGRPLAEELHDLAGDADRHGRAAFVRLPNRAHNFLARRALDQVATRTGT